MAAPGPTRRYPYYRSRIGELRYDGPSWEVARRKPETRRACADCECVLYVRSSVDFAPGQHDLDEIFPVADGVLCYRCAKGRGLQVD
jgi:hypothetical protein